MRKRLAPRSRKPRSRRFPFRQIFLRPLNLLLLAGFVLGILVAGWAQYKLAPRPSAQVTSIAVVERPVSAPQRVEDIIARVPQEPLSAPPSAPPVAVYDYRLRGYGSSAAPTTLRTPQYEEPPAAVDAAEVAALPVVPADPIPPMRGQRPRIAIVIDDVGPDYRGSRAAVGLPAPVTLAFLPYAEKLQALVAQAKANGHELLVHMPMEPDDLAHNNPGPDALLTTLDAAELKRRLTKSLNSFSGYVGVNNHMGSRFTKDRAAMELVMAELARRHLFFLDSRTTPQSVGLSLAEQHGLRYVGRDVFLDNEIDVVKILAQLRQTEQVARRRGAAVAIGHPHAATIEALKQWIPQAKQAGFEFVEVSRLTRQLTQPQLVSHQ